jgi:hypothetical protein
VARHWTTSETDNSFYRSYADKEFDGKVKMAGIDTRIGAVDAMIVMLAVAGVMILPSVSVVDGRLKAIMKMRKEKHLVFMRMLPTWLRIGLPPTSPSAGATAAVGGRPRLPVAWQAIKDIGKSSVIRLDCGRRKVAADGAPAAPHWIRNAIEDSRADMVTPLRPTAYYAAVGKLAPTT